MEKRRWKAGWNSFQFCQPPPADTAFGSEKIAGFAAARRAPPRRHAGERPPAHSAESARCPASLSTFLDHVTSTSSSMIMHSMCMTPSWPMADVSAQMPHIISPAWRFLSCAETLNLVMNFLSCKSGMVDTCRNSHSRTAVAHGLQLLCSRSSATRVGAQTHWRARRLSQSTRSRPDLDCEKDECEFESTQTFKQKPPDS